MVVHILHHISKGTLVEKTDGQPGRIRRQAQYVKRAAGIQIQFLAGFSMGQLFHSCPEGIGGNLLRKLLPKKRRRCVFLVDRLRSFRPADDGIASNTVHIVSVCQEIIQCRGVSKGSVFAHRGIETLFLAIGAESRRIERHNGRATGLSSGNALNGGMHRLRHIRFSRHQALGFDSSGLVIMGLPGSSDGGILLGELPVDSKYQVCAFHQLIPIEAQGRMLPGQLRIPGIKVGTYCPCHRGIYAIQNLMMHLPASLKAFQTPFRLSFLIDAKNIAGIVPQEIGQYAHRSLNSGGKAYFLRTHYRFFPGLHLHKEGNHLDQLPIFIQTQGITNFCRTPTRPGDFAPVNQILI